MILFTDLTKQNLEIKDEIDAAIKRVIDSSNFITGSITSDFERAFADFVEAEDCCATGSGTTALMCALMAVGITDGDEVIDRKSTRLNSSH